MGSYERGDYSLGGTSPVGYIDPSDTSAKNIDQMMDHFYQNSYPQNASHWSQGSVDTRMKVGDQRLNNAIYGDNQYYQSRRFYFNLIMRHINMICGYQRKNRKSTITLPAYDNDPVSDDYNTVLKWCDDRDGFQEYLSQSFEGACTTGISLLHLYPDYTFDPISGDLFTDQVAYNNFLIDPYWRKMDFSDCSGIWRRRWVTKTQAKALLPVHAKEIDKMRPGGVKDGRFPLQAELLNLATNQLFSYDEYHYRTTREGTIILDPKTGEAAEWEPDPEDPSDMLERVLAEQPWLIPKKIQLPTVKMVIKLGNKVMYNGNNQLNIDEYPFVPTLCYHEPDIQSYMWRIFGVVRNMRDAQYLYNRRKVIELSILESQINSGWIYPVDTVTDSKAFRQTGEGYLIPLKAGKTPADIQRIEPASIPPSLLELSRSLAEDITKISGVNEELLGAATDDKSGILSMLRQGAGLVTLQTIFDKLDYTQRLYGKIRLQAIRKNFSKGKIRNILGHEADMRFFTSHSQKYGITVEEGNYSATQRQEELRQLIYMKENMQIPIANKTIINAAFITNKKQVIADMEEEQKAQSQAQQQQNQIDMEEKKAKIQGSLAKARSDTASAQEKIAKIHDLEASAEHKRTQADLDLVKTMVELEDMDLANFRASLEMAEVIKARNSNQSLQAQEAI